MKILQKILTVYWCFLLLFCRSVTQAVTSSPTGAPTGFPSSSPSGQPTRIPSTQPTGQPSSQPSSQPTKIPSMQPTGKPSNQPSSQPSSQPTGKPSNRPSGIPSSQPSSSPSGQPTEQPSSRPTSSPTDIPSVLPSSQPSRSPSGQPSDQPSTRPSDQPSSRPTESPSTIPSCIPSSQPSISPTEQPSGQPSSFPTVKPSSFPSGQPSVYPSGQPSCQPYSFPTTIPSCNPSSLPSGQPSTCPVTSPSSQPSSRPTCVPSCQPSVSPTCVPSLFPSSLPSSQPSVAPSRQPISHPSSVPTNFPSNRPSICPSGSPSEVPSTFPSVYPSSQPSSAPTQCPASLPSTSPSTSPSSLPSCLPSCFPSSSPSELPSSHPSQFPSSQPSGVPSRQPFAYPSSRPTVCPSSNPTRFPLSMPSTAPTVTPSSAPTSYPNSYPSSEPSVFPSSAPTSYPNSCPSSEPSVAPSSKPSFYPSSIPTGSPSQLPSSQPTLRPSSQPSSCPSHGPITAPTSLPSISPSSFPSSRPSCWPSSIPSCFPSSHPSSQPISQPTGQPTLLPSSQPSQQPISSPSSRPSTAPSTWPSSQPSSVPTFAPSSIPTTKGAVRRLSCGECVSQSDSVCEIYPENVVVECNAGEICAYRGYERITIGPNTNLTFLSSCSVIFQSQYFTLFQDSIISGYSINITAQIELQIFGRINTNAVSQNVHHDVDGSTAGWGGSYGGSGGRPACDTYFSNTVDQIGDFDMSISSWPKGLSPLFGFSGYSYDQAIGGLGGGVILLASNAINMTGGLYAEGGSSVGNAGGGSGGSILLYGNVLSGKGRISVRGGNARGIGGGGGGGRIYFQVISVASSSIQSNLFHYNISLQGGQNINGYRTNCTHGSSGSMFVSWYYNSHVGLLSFVDVANNTFACSLVQRLPDYTRGISFSRANGIVMSSIDLPMASSCSMVAQTIPSVISSNLCSYFSIFGSTIYLSSNSSLVDKSNAMSLSVTCNQFIMTHSLFGVLEESTYFSLSTMYVDTKSILSVESICSISSSSSTVLLGVIGDYWSMFSPNNSKIAITAGGNVTIAHSYASRISITASSISLPSHSSFVSSFNQGFSTCLLPTNGSCHRGTFSPEPSDLNNSIVMVAKYDISIGSFSSLSSSAIILCAEIIQIASESSFSSSGRGCACQQGLGAGSYQAVGSYGGAGAGHGGNGGNGYGQIVGGSSYGKSWQLASGSGGGGCFGNIDGYGGGIIGIYALRQLTFNGSFYSNGIEGASNRGGGSGGMILIASPELQGYGRLSVIGGNGGSGSTPGGGGGGGIISLTKTGSSSTTSSEESSYSFSFAGIFSLNGGNAGSVTTGGAMMASSMDATSGQSGISTLPSCPPGWGGIGTSSVADGNLCQECPFGQYSPGGSNMPCMMCTNGPNNVVYTSSGTENNCEWSCKKGYVSESCVTPIQHFINTSLGGTAGVAGMLIGFLLIFFLPLTYFRLRKKYGWFSDKDSNIYGINFGGVHFDERGFMIFGNNAETDAAKLIDSSNPLFRDSFCKSDVSFSVNESPVKKSNSDVAAENRANAKTMKELRKAFRLSDNDVHHHACRIYFVGTNHPFQCRGGPWILPSARPVSLRPTVKRAEFLTFATAINDLMKWNIFSWEIILISIFSFIFPPFASLLMGSLRYKKGLVLLQAIAHYNHSFFKSKIQRGRKDSIRIGISPDFTLAYLDILFDEEVVEKIYKPLCPIGQSRLPVALRFAGLGTFFSPFFVDTNDLILQAISQTDVASSFIDEAWIAFVVELNAMLRTLYASNIKLGIIRLIKFFEDQSISSKLGGLKVELCCFPNYCIHSLSDHQKELLDEIIRQSMSNSEDDNWHEDENERRSGSNWMDDIVDAIGRVNFLPRSESKSKDNRESIEMKASISVANSAALDIEPEKKSSAHVRNEKKVSSSRISSFRTNLKNHLINFPSLFGASSKEMIMNNVSTVEELIQGINSGNLSLGVKITHPKIDFNYTVFEDDDYFSDDDDRPDGVRVNEESNSFSEDISQSSESSLSISSDSPLYSRDPIEAAQRAYRERAHEMTKFYNIMISAENSMIAKSGNKANPLIQPASDSIDSKTTSPSENLKVEMTNITSLSENISSNHSSLRTGNPVDVSTRPSSSRVRSSLMEMVSGRPRSGRLDSPIDSTSGGGRPRSGRLDSRTNSTNGRRPRSGRLNNRMDSTASDGEKKYEEFASSFQLDMPISRPSDIEAQITPRMLHSFSQSGDEFEDEAGSKSHRHDDLFRSIIKMSDFSTNRRKRCIDPTTISPSCFQYDIAIWCFHDGNIVRKLNFFADRGLIIADNPMAAHLSSISRPSALESLEARSTFEISNGDGKVTTSQNIGFHMGYSLGGIVHYRLYDPFYASLTTNILVGCNIYPIGGRVVRRILGVVIFVACLVDAMLVLVISAFMYCVGPNPTSCSDHYSIIEIYLIWPGSLILSPILGLMAMMLGPHAILSRIYSIWLRLSFLSVIVTIANYVYYLSNFSQVPYAYYIIVALGMVTMLQVLVIDLYIAHVDRMRWTRGWDGLTTSLFVTQDNKLDYKY